MSSDQKFTFLLLEDSDPDAFLLKRHLARIVPTAELHVASNESDFKRLMKALSPDVIISDYRLPQYSGIEALMFARVHAPVVPFIFVTGALNNEELAADTILKGASGFVLKNNLDKLDILIPPLLGKKAMAPPLSTASKTPVAQKVAEEHTNPSDILAKLDGANAETLAAIKALLGK